MQNTAVGLVRRHTSGPITASCTKAFSQSAKCDQTSHPVQSANRPAAMRASVARACECTIRRRFSNKGRRGIGHRVAKGSDAHELGLLMLASESWRSLETSWWSALRLPLALQTVEQPEIGDRREPSHLRPLVESGSENHPFGGRNQPSTVRRLVW